MLRKDKVISAGKNTLVMINADYMLLRENIFHFKQREKYVKRNRASVNYELTSDGLMCK